MGSKLLAWLCMCMLCTFLVHSSVNNTMQTHCMYFVFSEECVLYIICLCVCIFLHLLVSYNSLLDENHTNRIAVFSPGMLGVWRLKSVFNWIWQNTIQQYLWVEITGTTFYTVYALSIHIHVLILQRERGGLCVLALQSLFSLPSSGFCFSFLWKVAWIR